MLFDFLMDLIGATNSDRWAHVVGFMPIVFILTAFVASAISIGIGFFVSFIRNQLRKEKWDFLDLWIRTFLTGFYLFPVIFIASFCLNNTNNTNNTMEGTAWKTTPGSETVLVPNDKEVKLSIVDLKKDKIIVQFGNNKNDRKEFYLDEDSQIEKSDTIEESSITSAVVTEKRLVQNYRGKSYYTPNKPREFLKINGKMKLKDSEKILNGVESEGGR